MKYILHRINFILIIPLLLNFSSGYAKVYPTLKNINTKVKNKSNQVLSNSLSNPVTNGDCGLNIPITDFSCEDLLIDISGENGTLSTDVFLTEVRIIIEHTWDNDLEITLTSPAGQTINLSSDNGGNGDNYGNFSTLCNSSTTFISNNLGNECNIPSIISASPPFIGTFLPQQNLSTFNTGTANGTWTLTVCDDEEGDFGLIQYVELFFESTNCIVPSFAYSTEIDSTSLALNWIAGLNCASSQIEYGEAGFILGTGTIISASCPPFEVSNLLPSTTYDFYIQEACTLGGFSNFSCSFSETTTCSPRTPTLYEDFETQTICETDCREDCLINGTWFNTNSDETDWIVHTEDTPTPDTGPNEDADGNANGKYIYLETSCIGGFGWEAELYSQCIDISADVDNCHFSFNYMMNGITVNNLKLQGTINGIQWFSLWETTGNQGEIWKKTYIDLSPFHGETMQFRFSSKKLSFSTKGDVAIDNIAFHGSNLSGGQTYTYYTDLDGDSYGVSNSSIQTCFSSPPNGFAAQDGDCNDLVSFINPGEIESPCDGFDQNCNPDDDNDLLPPLGVDASVCSGETAVLFAAPQYFGSIYWYDSPSLEIPIHIGTSFLPPSQENTTSEPIDFTYYAVEVAFPGCSSGVAAEVTLTINPTPQTDQSYNEFICLGESIDLSDYPFMDENQTSYTLSYHPSLPAENSNQLSSSIITPNQNSIYFIVATTSEGCSDAIPFAANIYSSPQPSINGSTEMCTGTTQILTVSDLGTDDSPYTYLWYTTGDTTNFTEINAPSSSSTENHIVAITGSNGCTAFDTLTVVTSNGLTPIAVTTFDVTTCAGNDGKVLLNPENNGILPYTCTWEGTASGSEIINSNNLVIDNLEQGAYSITLTDASGGLGCSAIIPFTVVNGPGAIVEVDALHDISCSGEENGSISLSIFGEDPTFEWSNGMTTEDISNLEIGDYTLTVTDGDCLNILDFAITEPTNLFIKPSLISDVSCIENEDGEIDIILLGGTPPYDLLWNTGQTGTHLENLSFGQYIVTLTDANACSLIDTFDISAPEALNIDLLLKVDISCNGMQDGLIKVDVTGGTPPYNYLWNNGSTLDNLSNIPEGNYSLTITDTKGCSASLNNILIGEPQPISLLDTLLQNPICFGSNTGLIYPQITGGTPFINSTNGEPYYEFEWSNGQNTDAIFNLAEGEYSLTVTDSKGCIFNSTFTLNGSVELNATFNVEAATCYGSSDGNIYLNSIIPDENAPYTYEWSNGSTEPNNENIPFGIYNVTITNANSCVVVKTLEVLAEQPILVTSDINHPNCHGEATGQITLDVFGSVPPYQYEWSNEANTDEEILDLTGGFYSVTINTDNGCYRIIDSIEIVEPELILFEVVSIDSVICNGTETGSIEMNITGGLPPYQYTWNGNGSTQEDLYNINAGEHTLNVTDQNLCSVSQSYTVHQAPLLNVSIDIPENSADNCEGVAVDSLPLIINGGRAEYDIFWNTGQTTSTIYDVEPGDYYATITDALGCEVEVFSKIDTETPPLELVALDTMIIQNCENNSNTTFCLELRGGQAPFSYLWDDASNGTTSSEILCRTLTFGEHSITVTDANACLRVYDFSVNYVLPLNLYMDEEGVSNIDCFGSENGSICPTITGGLQPYLYQWSWIEDGVEMSAETECIENLKPGIYHLSLIDARGCEVMGDWDIVEPESVTSYEIDTIVHVTCFGAATGLIDMSFEGGTHPYSYEWSNGETTEDIDELTAGLYGLTITDAKNCVRIIDSTLLEIQEPLLTVYHHNTQIEDALCFQENGLANIEILGGTFPYYYNWSFPNTPDSNEVELPADNYSCTVTDSNGCELIVEDILVNEPTELTIDLTIDPEEYGSVSVEINGGTPFSGENYSILWSNGGTGIMTSGYTTGQHSVTITDANGCQKTNNFIINPSAINDALLVENYQFFPNPTTDKVIFSLTLSEANNTKIEIYNILGQKVISQSKSNFLSGNYSLDFSNFTAGTYFLSLFVEGDFVGNVKVVKL